MEKKNSNSHWSYHWSKTTYAKTKSLVYFFTNFYKKKVISSLNKDIFDFISKSRSDKIKRLLVTQDYLSGGLKMINIDHFITALKSLWIKRLTQKQKPWMNLFFAINGNDVVDRLFHFGDCYIPQCLLQKNNTFWPNV